MYLKEDKMSYTQSIAEAASTVSKYGSTWNSISPEYVARMRLQNRFKTGLDIARHTASVMRKDMAAYDADPSKYTQSLAAGTALLANRK